MFDTFFQFPTVCVFLTMKIHKSILKKATETIYIFLDSHPPPLLLTSTNLCFLKTKIVRSSKIQLLAIYISSDSFNW